MVVWLSGEYYRCSGCENQVSAGRCSIIEFLGLGLRDLVYNLKIIHKASEQEIKASIGRGTCCAHFTCSLFTISYFRRSLPLQTYYKHIFNPRCRLWHQTACRWHMRYVVAIISDKCIRGYYVSEILQIIAWFCRNPLKSLSLSITCTQ